MTPKPDRPLPGAIKVMSALLTPLPYKEAEFSQTLRTLQEDIRLQPGCIECTVGRDLGGEPRFLLITVWKGRAFLEAHLESEAFRILLGATSVLTAPAGFRFISANSAFSSLGFLKASEKSARALREDLP